MTCTCVYYIKRCDKINFESVITNTIVTVAEKIKKTIVALPTNQKMLIYHYLRMN